ncbi:MULTISPECIES: trigger factor [unclassified Mycoplasma]|uniref:trigger factor n=1 Tax=Mycoplasma sp. 125 TaxID=3447505 RepID=UPI003F657D59
MSRKFNEENTELIIDYTINGEEWTKAYEKAQKSLANDVTIPGFRKGKAPLKEALKRVDPFKIFNKVIHDKFDDVYKNHIITQIKDEDKIINDYHPSFDVSDYSDQGATYVFRFPLFPNVNLGEYKKLNTKLNIANIDKKMIEGTKETILKNYAVSIESNEPIKMGDSVNFDFTGYINGEKFEGGEAEKFDIVIGSNQFIPGFEEQMVNLNRGESKDINLKFPETYHAKELAGKDVVFKVKINSVKTNNYPEVNDQFLKEAKINPLVNTIEQFNEYVEFEATKAVLQVASQTYTDEAINEIIKNSSITISNIIINEEAEKYYKSFIQQLKQKGISERDYFEFTKTNKEDVLKTYQDEAFKNLFKSFVLGKIVDEENLQITDEEYENKVNEIAKSYNLKPEQIKTFVSKKSLEQNELPHKIFTLLVKFSDSENYEKYRKLEENIKQYEKNVEQAIVKMVQSKPKDNDKESTTKADKAEK